MKPAGTYDERGAIEAYALGVLTDPASSPAARQAARERLERGADGVNLDHLTDGELDALEYLLVRVLDPAAPPPATEYERGVLACALEGLAAGLRPPPPVVVPPPVVPVTPVAASAPIAAASAPVVPPVVPPAPPAPPSSMRTHRFEGDAKVAGFEWDPATGALLVTLATGARNRYRDVSELELNAWIATPSPGRWLGRYLRGRKTSTVPASPSE